jgi:hypothetical protein
MKRPTGGVSAMPNPKNSTTWMISIFVIIQFAKCQFNCSELFAHAVPAGSEKSKSAMTRRIYCGYFKLQTDRRRGFLRSQCLKFNTCGCNETQRTHENIKISLTRSADFHSHRCVCRRTTAVGCVHRSHRPACAAEPSNDFETI